MVIRLRSPTHMPRRPRSIPVMSRPRPTWLMKALPRSWLQTNKQTTNNQKQQKARSYYFSCTDSRVHPPPFLCNKENTCTCVYTCVHACMTRHARHDTSNVVKPPEHILAMFRGFRPTFSRQTVGFAVTSPGVKLLSVRIKASVEMISDEIFCFNFSGTIFRYIVPIHHHVHQQSDAAAHGDRMEGE